MKYQRPEQHAWPGAKRGVPGAYLASAGNTRDSGLLLLSILL